VLRVTDPRSGVWATRPQDAPSLAGRPGLGADVKEQAAAAVFRGGDPHPGYMA